MSYKRKKNLSLVFKRSITWLKTSLFTVLRFWKYKFLHWKNDQVFLSAPLVSQHSLYHPSSHCHRAVSRAHYPSMTEEANISFPVGYERVKNIMRPDISCNTALHQLLSIPPLALKKESSMNRKQACLYYS